MMQFFKNSKAVAKVEYSMTIAVMAIVTISLGTILTPAVDERICDMKNTYSTETCVEHGASVPLDNTITPNPFPIGSASSVPRNMPVISSPRTVSGFDGRVFIQVTGEGDPRISIENRSWVRSGFIEAGQEFRVRMISSRSASTPHTSTVTLGNRQENFVVTTN